MSLTITISLAMITMVQAGHTDHYAKPYYNFEYGVEAYGVGYGHGHGGHGHGGHGHGGHGHGGHGHGGHGDPGPLPYSHKESRDGYNTQVRDAK